MVHRLRTHGLPVKLNCWLSNLHGQTASSPCQTSGISASSASATRSEKVRMVDLHHAFAVPPLVALRPPIAVDHHHLVPAPGQRDSGVQAGRTCPQR